jgi:hypothetical protein
MAGCRRVGHAPCWRVLTMGAGAHRSCAWCEVPEDGSISKEDLRAASLLPMPPSSTVIDTARPLDHGRAHWPGRGRFRCWPRQAKGHSGP